VFFVSSMFAELRRRRGRTILTALGLAVGVALVIAVTALSTGLDRAQAKVLEPLTGVGTDMSVTRPIRITQGGGPFGNLSRAEQKRLRSEQGGGGPLNFRDLKPGARVDQDSFQASQLSFSQSQVAKTENLSGVAAAAGALTLNDVHVHGKAPKIRVNQGSDQGGQGIGGPPAGGSFGNSSLKFDSRTVTGIDQTTPDLAAVTPSQIVKGDYFTSGAAGAGDAILSSSYANTNKLSVGDTVTLDNHVFTVVGIASSPLGGTASDVYVELSRLQKISGYEGQINTLQVRAAGTGDVATVAKEIRQQLKGAQVTTAQTLAKRVSGSLNDTRNLSARLGTGLELVGLLAAVLIASLLALSSVAKRTRELGTLKALGWSSFQVVRQIAGESVLQGLLGGAIGILLGLGAVAAINAVDWTLKATVVGSSAGNQPGPGGGGPFGFGQTAITSGSTLVRITTSADAGLILLAVVLAVLGGLTAGVVGGLRAARLRPAVALRTVE
jgi:ABC-type antimicrobial peptide transport system permease subunit